MSVSTRNRRTFTALLAAGALAATLGACSGVGDSRSSSASAPTASSSAAMAGSTASTEVMADQPFGSACAAVPKDGAGSFTGMAKDPVATAASNNPLLSTLVAAVKQAGLVDTLNSAQNITVFAPTNDAFAKIPKADLDALLADKAKLTKVLTYHVAPASLAPNSLAGTHKTLEGGDLTVTGVQPGLTVNGNSKVLCGNVRTANATVYIVDTVLMPAS